MYIAEAAGSYAQVGCNSTESILSIGYVRPSSSPLFGAGIAISKDISERPSQLPSRLMQSYPKFRLFQDLKANQGLERWT